MFDDRSDIADFCERVGVLCYQVLPVKEEHQRFSRFSPTFATLETPHPPIAGFLEAVRVLEREFRAGVLARKLRLCKSVAERNRARKQKFVEEGVGERSKRPNIAG